MNLLPALPPDLVTVINRFSNDELYQIGTAFIRQAQDSIQIPHSDSSQRAPRAIRSLTRPSSQILSSIPPLMNHQQNSTTVRPLMEQQITPSPLPTSTPRRPASDNSDNNGENFQHKPKRPKKNNTYSPHRHPQQPLQRQQNDPSRFSHPNPQPHFNISILKRAISNNLPCFYIEFDPSADLADTLSCTQVAIMLKKMFINNQLPIKELSMCVQAGERRFKFAVVDKVDFLTLFRWHWPNKIENRSVEITKPRSLPNCFALVVRYIPMDVNHEHARLQIISAIPAAVGFSMIKYNQRQRPSYDLRFNVVDIEQYQTALELGRITIGQHYLPLTNFYTGYQLTYCTACWKIGHMRDKCRAPICCRKCLIPYTDGENHMCQGNNLICAQCGGNHFSLDATCPIIRKYKNDLKVAVDKALASGSIRRPPPGEPSRPFHQQPNDFPELNPSHTRSRSAWKKADTDNTQYNLKNEINDIGTAIRALSDTVNRIENKFNQTNKLVEAQDNQIKALNESTIAIIDALQLMSKWIHANSNERTKLKKNISKSMEDILKSKQKLDLNNNKKNKDSIPSTTSPQPITTATTNSTSSTKNNVHGEVETNGDHSMNSIDDDA